MEFCEIISQIVGWINSMRSFVLSSMPESGDPELISIRFSSRTELSTKNLAFSMNCIGEIAPIVASYLLASSSGGMRSILIPPASCRSFLILRILSPGMSMA